MSEQERGSENAWKRAVQIPAAEVGKARCADRPGADRVVLGHLKGECPHLEQIRDPGKLEAEMSRQ